MSKLYQWPNGLRYVPFPSVCPCGAPTEGILTWWDKIGRQHDLAGCRNCVAEKKKEVIRQGHKYVTGRKVEDELARQDE